MELLKAYLKERRLTLAAFLLFVGVFAVSFALYGLPLAAVGYPAGDGARRPVGGYDRLLHRMGAPDQDAHRRHAPDPAG